MNEQKPEDAMKALEYCSVYKTCDGCPHFNGVPEYDCRTKAMANALALLREMKKQIRKLEDDVENFKSIAEYQQNCNMKRYFELKEKDARIEELEAELKEWRR